MLASIAHPALPRYIDHFEEGGELFLVTEKIEGESLSALKQGGAALGEADVVRLLRDAAGALDYLHGRAPPIIHRDLKPSNVLRRPDGSFAFIDFGAVRDKLKPEGGSTVVGTFGYMAPEQFQGRAMPASDVYGIGATALAMLTGREPEELPHRGLSIDVEAALRGARVSPALVRLLGSMLEPDPDRRLQTLGPALATVGREAPRPSDRPGRSERREEERSRRLARREERHARRERDSGGLLPGLVFAVVLLALTFAEIAVMVALRVVVPLVLTVLSLFFGKGLRRAAETVAASGTTATASIRRAREGVRRRDQDVRVRIVEGTSRARVDLADAADAEDEAAEDEAADETRRGQTRRR